MDNTSSVIIVTLVLFAKVFVSAEDKDELPHVTMEEIYMGNTTLSDNVSSPLFVSSAKNAFEDRNSNINLSWVNKAIRDVGYYLRRHKFNEYDRRYNTKAPDVLGQYYSEFPKPPLRSLHWEVHKHCEPSFLHCLEYLSKKIRKVILQREDDTSIIINEQKWTLNNNSAQVKSTDVECKELKRRDNIYAIPFQGPLERFQWKTTASYYMCWYTMNGIPELQYFGEECDNYASCLDSKYGSNNKDPRASDAKSFFCALYSMCPDPCCPLRHIATNTSCWKTEVNPCFYENRHDINNLLCQFDRNRNTDFTDIVLNHWNVTCQCSKPGYLWESRYGICVDINECTTNEHNCDVIKEVCLNLPGSFRCACNWGYIWNENLAQCTISPALNTIKRERYHKNETEDIHVNIKSIIKYLYYKLFTKSSALLPKVYQDLFVSLIIIRYFYKIIL